MILVMLNQRWIFKSPEYKNQEKVDRLINESAFIYIYIYILVYRQICFVLSELISVAWQYLPVAGIETRSTQTPSQSF